MINMIKAHGRLVISGESFSNIKEMVILHTHNMKQIRHTNHHSFSYKRKNMKPTV